MRSECVRIHPGAKDILHCTVDSGVSPANGNTRTDGYILFDQGGGKPPIVKFVGTTTGEGTGKAILRTVAGTVLPSAAAVIGAELNSRAKGPGVNVNVGTSVNVGAPEDTPPPPNGGRGGDDKPPNDDTPPGGEEIERF